MFKNGFGSGKKAASVTLELMLAILLAVLVLFFILSTFSDNLRAMVANSNIKNMFDNHQKITYTNQSFDPTSVNVQVLAEQGGIITPSPLNTLDDFKHAAIDKVNHYATNPPQNEAEVLDLAKWATIAQITTGSTVLTEELATTFSNSYGINIDALDTYTTTVGSAIVNGHELTIDKQFSFNVSSGGVTGDAYKLLKSNTIFNAGYVVSE